MISQVHSAQLTRARTVGGNPSIYIANDELLFLLCLVCRDLDISLSQLNCKTCLSDTTELYDIPVLSCRCSKEIDDSKLNIFLGSLIQIPSPDVFTYFLALISLHAQRRKFHAILDYQSIPELETIIPRGLLELGMLPTDHMASWLLWRKFIYDIDNRAAQTTGYLFEPILAASIGGVSYSASKSPIRRDGVGSGRQVDCIRDKDAYEFKMRVTIAASGQGRFSEELSFAKDCQASGYRPILLVLDPTPSVKLDELSTEYKNYGGEAYIGDSAWTYLENQAGDMMATFLEKYIRKPIQAIGNHHFQIKPIQLAFDFTQNKIRLTIDDMTVYLGE